MHDQIMENVDEDWVLQQTASEEWTDYMHFFSRVWLKCCYDMVCDIHDHLAEHRTRAWVVLIHCRGGVNRSVGALCSLVMCLEQCPPPVALKYVLQKRAKLCPFYGRSYMVAALWVTYDFLARNNFDFSDLSGSEFELCSAKHRQIRAQCH